MSIEHKQCIVQTNHHCLTILTGLSFQCVFIYEVSIDTSILSWFKWLLKTQDNGKLGCLCLTLFLEYVILNTLTLLVFVKPCGKGHCSM